MKWPIKITMPKSRERERDHEEKKVIYFSTFLNKGLGIFILHYASQIMYLSLVLAFVNMKSFGSV